MIVWVILLKLDSNRWFFSPCDLEIPWMTSKNHRAPLLHYINLCAQFQTPWWMQTMVKIHQRAKLRANKAGCHYISNLCWNNADSTTLGILNIEFRLGMHARYSHHTAPLWTTMGCLLWVFWSNLLFNRQTTLIAMWTTLWSNSSHCKRKKYNCIIPILFRLQWVKNSGLLTEKLDSSLTSSSVHTCIMLKV